MKKYIIMAMAIFCSQVVTAQSTPAMPDVNKLLKMSPSELEAYKKQMLQEQTNKAADLIEKNNLDIDVRRIPGYDVKPPEKNIAKLALIPSRPPTRQELVSGVQQSIGKLKQGIPAPKMQEIEKFSAAQSVASIHDASIMSFYHGDPSEGMMLLMKAVEKNPDSVQMINNLGAMFNMVGLEHKAIPMLQYCMERAPFSSTIFNNMGQSFMALGDALRAAEYLNKSLELDSLNIEANHSMGMLHVFKKEYAQAMKFFEREMSIATRRSTLAMAYKSGKEFNLRELTERKHARNGVPKKNSFEEVTMGKFSMPNFPGSALEAKLRVPEFKAYSASVQFEAQHWLNVMNNVSRIHNGNEHPGIYSDLVDAMLEELHKEFNPKYLVNYSEDDAKWVQEIMEDGLRILNNVKCPSPPGGVTLEARQAYEVKCCEENKRPLADKVVQDLGSHLQKITSAGQQRWKSYINQLVAIVQLEPSASNQATVYGAVAGYFNYLSWGSLFYTTGDINNLLAGCKDDYNPAQTDSTIASDHEWRVACPAWLNLSVDLGGVAVKADCNKFAVEAGKAWTFGYEHEFNTGNSTFLVGPATKLEFLGGMVKAESKTQFFLTFDKNKEFADFGVKNTLKLGASANPFRLGGIKLGGNLGSVEISNSVSINNGYKASSKTSGFAKILE